jgi:hypothetical protein
MRFQRAFLALSGSACAAMLLAGQVSPAHAAASNGCLSEGQVGSYLSKEGSAKATFSREFLDGLAENGITFEAIEPIEMIDDGTAVRMPIGERYDNIETPSGRVCYPGGFKFTKPDGTTYVIETFWVLFAAVADSKFLGTPVVNGAPRAGGELTMVNFSVPQAFTTGQFVPHNGGIGPKRVVLSLDSTWADDLNRTLGTSFYGGQHWADLDIAWSGAPTRPIPSGASVGLLGLKVISDAIRNGGPSIFPSLF